MGASAARKAQRLRDGTTKPEDLPSPISAPPETETKAGADNAPLAKSDLSQELESHGKNVRFIAFVGEHHT